MTTDTETIRLQVIYYEAKQYFVDVTKQELIDIEFDFDNKLHLMDESRFEYVCSEFPQDPSVNVLDENEELFNHWLEEWEEQE